MIYFRLNEQTCDNDDRRKQKTNEKMKKKNERKSEKKNYIPK